MGTTVSIHIRLKKVDIIMLDRMSDSDVSKEIDFWLGYNQPYNDFKHKQYYVDFFDFSIVKGDVIEIGCGGSPFITYTKEYILNNSINLTLIDPLFTEIAKIEKYSFLNQYKYHSNNLLNYNTENQYNYIICLNVLDHFKESHVDFISKMKSLLMDNGRIYLYYDIRESYNDGHYAVNHSTIYNYIVNNFTILKESYDINPEHKGWSTIYKSYRAILSK